MELRTVLSEDGTGISVVAMDATPVEKALCDCLTEPLIAMMSARSHVIAIISQMPPTGGIDLSFDEAKEMVDQFINDLGTRVMKIVDEQYLSETGLAVCKEMIREERKEEDDDGNGADNDT